MALLDAYDIRLAGRHAVNVGRSPILGRPVGMLLLARDATATYCHSLTVDLARYIAGLRQQQWGRRVPSGREARVLHHAGPWWCRSDDHRHADGADDRGGPGSRIDASAGNTVRGSRENFGDTVTSFADNHSRVRSHVTYAAESRSTDTARWAWCVL
jgi:hypothetical protein